MYHFRQQSFSVRICKKDAWTNLMYIYLDFLLKILLTLKREYIRWNFVKLVRQSIKKYYLLDLTKHKKQKLVLTNPFTLAC